MQWILDPPMTTHGYGKDFGITAQATDVVSHFIGSLVPQPTFRDEHPNTA